MTKDSHLKRLQQHVSRLRTQQQKRTNRVVEIQVEAIKVTCIIQISHEKLLQYFGSMGMTTSEHISSKFVQQLKIVQEEVR